MKISDDLSVWEEPEERGKGHNRNDNEDGLEEKKGCWAIGSQGRSTIRVWFLTVLHIGNMSFYINPECFLVPLNLNVSQLGLTLNLLIGCV